LFEAKQKEAKQKEAKQKEAKQKEAKQKLASISCLSILAALFILPSYLLFVCPKRAKLPSYLANHLFYKGVAVRRKH
jgi:formate/nitrite transporter FocA (FNT family)